MRGQGSLVSGSMEGGRLRRNLPYGSFSNVYWLSVHESAVVSVNSVSKAMW